MKNEFNSLLGFVLNITHDSWVYPEAVVNVWMKWFSAQSVLQGKSAFSTPLLNLLPKWKAQILKV